SADIAANISNIGVPIPTLRTYVLDSRRELVPAGVWGELYVGGAGVSRGYLNREELTGERFMDSWLRAGERLYRSGDRVRWLPHGEMEYGGRFDEQVKIRGYRIELGEIASTLESHGEVSRALVIARPGTGGLQELVAYVICPETLSPEDLRSWLGRRLPDYMLPAGFVRLEALPLTANGKIDRKKLPSYDSSAISSGVAYMAPSNAWEEKLVALFAAELNRAPERTSVKDNFFALGGDSIKGMKLVVKIKKAFNTGITIANLYQHQTVDTLAAWLQQNQLADTLEQEWHAGMEEIAALRQQIEYEHGGTGILPAAYEDMYPVTPIEQGMIYSSMLRPEEPVYYDQFTSFVQITDIDAFKACLEKLVERHAALRTRYYMQTFRQPIKIVLPEITIPVSYEDLSALHDEEKIVRLRTFLQKDIAIRLAFDNDLLWRLKMLYLGEGKYYLVLNCHHAMIDGWGVSIFSSELANLLGDNPPELRPLKHSYKDYCAIILGRKKSEATANYWRSLLLGYSRNKLPFNYKGLKITEAAGMKKISRVLDNTLLQQLNRLSEDNRLSFKAICLAAHIYLLHIVSSEKDVVTGVVTHERPELEDSTGILGCFLNTVPVRVDFEKVKDTRTLLRTVQDFLVASKPHEVHLSEVAGFISEKASGENPVFDTLFNFTDFHNYRNVNNTSLLAPVAAPFGAVTGEAGEMTNTLFDVELDKTMDRFLLKIKYTPAYFHEEEVHYALSLYERILVSFVADISAPLVPEQLLPEAERNALLFGFNATLAPYASEKTIHRLFEEQVLKTPDQVALSQHGHDLTYEALNKRANQVAACLLETGVKPGDNVGLLVTRTFDMIVGMYGILKAGGAYVPVDPEYPADRQEYIINNSGLNTLLVNTPPPEALAGKLQHVTFISLRDSKIDTQPAEDPAIVVDSRQLAYTIYTSGSTGRPKGVMIEHHSAVNLIEWVNDTFEINHNDRLLFITSMCFDLSVYDVFGILAAGGTVVIATQEEVQDVRKLQQLMVDERISFWDSVPTTMNYLVGELELDGGLYRQNNLRLVFLSGDWIPVQLPGTIRKYFPNAQVISLGGATEGTVWSNYYPIGKVPATWSSIPYGVPLKNNFFYILDDNFQPVPRGVAGELYIGGIGVARGYANDPEKTNAAFKPDPFNSSLGGRMYKTGDLGRLMADGNMEFLGRKDNQVKIRGFRVELGEIESVLLKHSGIKEAIVNVIKDAANNNQLCAYLVPKTVVDRKEVRDYLKAVFPAYMVPDHYLVLEALPLNSNGKIDRKALPSPVADESNDLAAYEPPQSALEKSIETIWKSLLKADKVSLTADFFDLGANSLSVGAFVNRVSRDMGLSLNIREVFMHPTIKGIAGLLAARNTGRVQHIQPAVEQPAYVLSSAQQRMWVLSQLDEHGAAYNIPGAFVLEGELDRIALDQAFAAVLERHEILRTVFREEEDGQVMQYVLPAELLANRITYGDLRNAADQEILLQQQVRTVSHTTFNMGSEPLVRACLYRLSDSKWVFAYVMHHIISDGWSVNLLMEELLRLYNAFHNNSSPALSPLRIQYKDYAVWQQSQLNSGLLYEHGVYWKSQLGGKLPVLRLPVDKPRPGVKTYNGAYLKRIVSKEVADRLRDYARNEGGTLFMGLLTVVNALMAAYTDQEDIILGTSVAGRENPELENQIGLYVNAVALRTRFAHTITFHELFRRVKQTTLQAYEHQLYPFDELVQVLDLERDLSRNLLFDVIVVLQNTNIEGSSSIPSMDGMTVTRYKSQARQSSQFDLSFDFFDTGAELVAGIEYNTDLFHSNTAQHIAEHLDHLLAAFTSDPAKRIDELGYRLPAQSPGAPPSGQLLQQSRKGIVNDLKL
ncbi:amino acid adenylation domain-containing protein, partial [Chitinophaga eiseniae]